VIRPKSLCKNAVIGIIAPASPQRDPDRLTRGVKYLEKLGYRVKYGPHIDKRHAGYLAGTDAERLNDLHVMFADPQVDAIFCARGGYGSARLLPFIDWDLLKKNPKIFVGFSDLTSLQLAIWKKIGLVTFSGALPSVDMADEIDAETEEWFWRVLTSTSPLGPLTQSLPLRRSRVVSAFDSSAIGSNAIQSKSSSAPKRAPLIPANLTVLCSMLGTPWMPSLRNALLVLEDIGEDTYRLDRLFTQLRLSGTLDSLSGLAFGYFTQAGPPTTSTPHRDVQELLDEIKQSTMCPFITGLMFGHEKKKFTLPIGVHASIASRSAALILHDAAVC